MNFLKSSSWAAITLAGMIAAAAPARADITFAVVGGMSGPFTKIGEEFKQGSRGAVEAINEAGGVLGEKLAFEVFDDECNAEKAVEIANQIVNLPYLDLTSGTLHGCSNVDAGADNNITTELIVSTDPGLWSENPQLFVNYFTPQNLATGSWTSFTIPAGTRRAYLFTADGSTFDARYNSDDDAVEKIPANTQWTPGNEGEPLGADFDVEFKATAGTPALGGFYLTRS